MKHENQVHTLSTLPSGKIRYTLTNDYMFRAVFQKNQNALKGLLSALLGIPKKQIKELRILNPIILGETIDDKTCILDLHLRLNNNELINIEMQVSGFGNWPERSITYLGRTFDQTQSGGDYSNISTAMHIGILDFNLTHLTPEFYSEFRLMNVKNQDFEDTIVTMQELSADEKVKLQCMARERYEWDLASAIAKGKREGEEIGLRKGKAEGEQRSFLLIQKLFEEGLTDLISKVASDPALRQELYKKYNI